jgi:hypothetical protein
MQGLVVPRRNHSTPQKEGKKKKKKGGKKSQDIAQCRIERKHDLEPQRLPPAQVVVYSVLWVDGESSGARFTVQCTLGVAAGCRLGGGL